MKVRITKNQFDLIKETIKNDIDERSRSFAFTRKKRLFSEPERMSNPLRYKFTDRIKKEEVSKEKETKKNESDKNAKFLTCKNCNKKFTQTIYGKKKSMPICPWCGTHNNEKK